MRMTWMVIGVILAIHLAGPAARADEARSSEGACALAGGACSGIRVVFSDDCVRNTTTGLYDCEVRWSGFLAGWGLFPGSTSTDACMGLAGEEGDAGCDLHALECEWLPARGCTDDFDFSLTEELPAGTCYDLTVEGVIQARMTGAPADTVTHPYHLSHTFCTGS